MVDIFSSYRVYFVAATLGAHSNSSGEGFRQKDLRFLLGLFLQWMSATTKGVDDQIHNTQISRYLSLLVRQGFAERTNRARPPQFALTRIGLLELLGQLTQVPIRAPIEQFFFVHMFARSYGGRLRELISHKDQKLPRSYQVEVESLLDPAELINGQIRAVQLELRKLDERIAESLKAAELARKLSNQKQSLDEIIREVGTRFPYDMNYQKPMTELLYEIPANLRLWELTSGNENRAELLFEPLRTYLENYLKQLQGLANLRVSR